MEESIYQMLNTYNNMKNIANKRLCECQQTKNPWYNAYMSNRNDPNAHCIQYKRHCRKN